MTKIFRDQDILDDLSFDLGSLVSSAQVDQLGHSTIAKQVAELAKESPGKVNIAVFGPWGSGKSSLFALMQSSLQSEISGDDLVMVPFDAWQNSGTDFSVNFLSALSKSDSARKSADISRQLFQSRRTLSLPFGLSSRPVWVRIAIFVIATVLIVAAIPLVWTLHLTGWNSDKLSIEKFVENVSGWLGFGLSGSVLLVLGAIGVELTRVSIDESAPSHNSQFRAIFDSIVGDKKKYVVFIDELDRCSSEQLMQTLEGLRTFLGHERVVFVAAFDRDSVATTIAKLRPSSGSQPSIDAAYYRTAGEYLDKIFQFQLSLPPKSTHTIRKFALELVEERAGIWKELADHGSLKPVVSLLSPAHIRSPRRTKILLNDFAVNARELQVLLGDGWIDRAREIAVWTVIQTEFPNLATDMAEEPQIPRYLVDREITPSRSGFATLVEQYRSAKTSLDEVTGADASLVRERQHQDLTRYLERVQSLRVMFPAPDIIWRTKSQAFDEFEDQGLYSALVGAADQSPSTTIAALRDASGADLQQAVEFLARLTEQEFAGEAELLGRVIGEIADSSATVVASKAPLISSIWRRIVDADTSWNSPSSARGYAKALASTETGAFLTNFAKQIRWAVPEASAEVLRVLVDGVPARRWPDLTSALSDFLIRELDNHSKAFVNALLREDQEPSRWLDDALILSIAETMTISDPDPVVPERGNAQGLAAAAEATERARNEINELRSKRHSHILEIGEAWDLLGGHGAVRLWLLKLLRSLGPIVSGADELHDQLLTRVGPGQSEDDNLILVMSAISDQPRTSLGRWSLPNRKAGESFELLDVVTELLTLCRGGDPVDESQALAQLTGIGSAFGTVTQLPASISDGLDALEVGADLTPWAHLLDALQILAEQFKSSEAAGARCDLLVALSVEATPATLPTLVSQIARETPKSSSSWRDSLYERLEHLEGQKLVSASTILMRIDDASLLEPPFGVPISVVRRLAESIAWPELLPLWVRTGPRFDRLRAVADAVELVALDSEVWEKYGQKTGIGSSSDAWRTLVASDAPPASLRAVAGAGVRAIVYETARTMLVDGNTDSDRARGMQRFLDLPKDNRIAASNAAQAILGLADGPSGTRSGDFKYVADLALTYHRKFTPAEKVTVRSALKRYHPSLVLHARRLGQLTLAGLR